MFLVESLSRFVRSGGKRTVKVKRNIISSFLIRGLSVVVNLAIVSMAIKFVDTVQYGVWLTITSIVSWFTFFDFGMANGLRNKLATALAFKDYDNAKKYISTTYAILGLIAITVFVLFFFLNPHVDWNSLLNIPNTVDENIHSILLILSGVLCVQFILQLINTVLNAMQESAKAELVTLLGQVCMLITLIILKFTVKGSLSVLIMALNVAPLVMVFLASLAFYNQKLRIVRPSIRSIDISFSKSILNLGGVFFLIQLGSLVLFQTDNIIITRILGPESVTKFNVTYKLYSVVLVVFAIIAAPYWSAFTDAYAKKDYEWINRSVKRLRQGWLFTSFVVVPVFYILSKYFFRIWLQDVITIDWSLSILMATYVVGSTCLSLHCYFLYGVGKLRVLLILYLLVTITNIPLGIALGKAFGIEGVIFSNIIAFIFMNTVLWIQTNKIVRHQAFGIWNH